MYPKGQSGAESKKSEKATFRGSFLMSPRVPLFQKRDGSYVPGLPPTPAEPKNRKDYVLFSRN